MPAKSKATKRKRFKRLPKGPNGGIQLLLVQSVDQLGKQGDVVEPEVVVGFPEEHRDSANGGRFE